MVALTDKTQETLIVYPSSDGKPVAETYDHLYTVLTTLEVLKDCQVYSQLKCVVAYANLR